MHLFTFHFNKNYSNITFCKRKNFFNNLNKFILKKKFSNNNSRVFFFFFIRIGFEIKWKDQICVNLRSVRAFFFFFWYSGTSVKVWLLGIRWEKSLWFVTRPVQFFLFTWQWYKRVKKSNDHLWGRASKRMVSLGRSREKILFCGEKREIYILKEGN